MYVPVGETQQALTALARSYAERYRIPKTTLDRALVIFERIA